MPDIKENILIAPHTTINLGGYAKYYTECNSQTGIIDSVLYSKTKNINYIIIGGGSNVVFPDEGYNGVVIKLTDDKIDIIDETDTKILIKVWAGTNWDFFTEWSVKNKFQGVECLSGIPGATGATPIQNVGAYGQEVSGTISKVTFLNKDLKEITLSNSQCKFSYRNSVFKSELKNSFIITDVFFKLSKINEPDIKYSDIISLINESPDYNSFLRREERLSFIRNNVIKIRRSKSMVYDKNDSESNSCGSFFTNPVLDFEKFNNVTLKFKELGFDLPFYKSENNYKISAAFLIEKAGFYKGFSKGNARISKKHTLALVNRNGTTRELLNLADEIKQTVLDKFSIELEIEPSIIKNIL